MPDIYGIDETALAGLSDAHRQRIYNALRVEDAVSKLGNNPKSRDAVQRLVAEHMPEIAGPEAMARKFVSEAAGEIRAEIQKDREEREKEKAERQAKEDKERFERQLLTGRAKLRDAGYTQEGIEAVEKLMEDRGIADHEAARALHERLNPPPEPVVTGGTSWNFFDRKAQSENDEAFKMLMSGDDEGFLSVAVPAALKEVRG